MVQETDIFDQLFELIRDFERQFRDQGDKDLSTTQFQALTILSQAEPMTAMGMATKLRIAGPTATRTLESLERRELIIKERDPQDRRMVWLRLTDRGRNAWQNERNRQRDWMVDRLGDLSADEQTTLFELMTKLTARAASRR